MKKIKLSFIIIGILGLMLALSPSVWAGGVAGARTCFMKAKKLYEAPTLVGEIAAVITPPEGGEPGVGLTGDLDVVVRLKKQCKDCKYRIYRMTLENVTLSSDDLDNLCLFFDPANYEIAGGPNLTAVTNLRDEILDEFFGTKRSVNALVVSGKSISGTESAAEIEEGERVIDNPEPTNRQISVASICLYAVEVVE